jgi:hypothetical protein
MPAKKKTAKSAIIPKETAQLLYDAFMVIGDVWAETGAEVGNFELDYLAGNRNL